MRSKPGVQKVKIRCPNCRSDNLDQGISEHILCHSCGMTHVIVPIVEFEQNLKDLDR